MCIRWVPSITTGYLTAFWTGSDRDSSAPSCAEAGRFNATIICLRMVPSLDSGENTLELVRCGILLMEIVLSSRVVFNGMELCDGVCIV